MQTSPPTVLFMRPRIPNACAHCRTAKTKCVSKVYRESGQPCVRCEKKGLDCVPASKKTEQYRKGSAPRVVATVPASDTMSQGPRVTTTDTEAELEGERMEAATNIQHLEQLPSFLPRALFGLPETVPNQGYALLPTQDWRTPAMQSHDLGQSSLYAAHTQWSAQQVLQMNDPGPSAWHTTPGYWASTAPDEGNDAYDLWTTPATQGKAAPSTEGDNGTGRA